MRSSIGFVFFERQSITGLVLLRTKVTHFHLFFRLSDILTSIYVLSFPFSAHISFVCAVCVLFISVGDNKMGVSLICHSELKSTSIWMSFGILSSTKTQLLDVKSLLLFFKSAPNRILIHRHTLWELTFTSTISVVLLMVPSKLGFVALK